MAKPWEKEWSAQAAVPAPSNETGAKAPRSAPPSYMSRVGRVLAGEAEAVGALVSGAIAQPLAGLAGIAGTLLPGEAGQGDRWVQGVSSALTYAPRTPEGQQLTGAIAKPFEALERGADYIGEVSGEPTDTLGATGVKTALLAVPMALGRGVRAPRVAPASGTPEAVAAAAQQAGYKLPPSGGVRQAAATVAGRENVEHISARANQAVTDRLAAEAIGLPKGERLTDLAIRRAREQANESYAAIPREVPQIKLDADYIRDVLALRSAGSNPSFPKAAGRGVNNLIKRLVQNEAPKTADVLDMIQDLRNQSRRAMRSENAATYELGVAQRQAADSLEALIGRNLEQSGNVELLANFRRARERLAKIHTLEDAIPVGSVHVDPQALVRVLKSGRPLTGELRMIAETAAAYPAVMRSAQAGARTLGLRDSVLMTLLGTSGFSTLGPAGVAAAAAAPLVSSGLARVATAAPTRAALKGATAGGAATATAASERQ